jgi:thiol-disulfide isomerase/thioredoxin
MQTIILTASTILFAVIFGIRGQMPGGLTEKMKPSLSGATSWLNSQLLNLASLHGKVVLIDFWTFTCINWRRTLPYIREWASKYKDQGHDHDQFKSLVCDRGLPGIGTGPWSFPSAGGGFE